MSPNSHVSMVSSCPTAAPQARIRADRGQLEKLL